MDFHGAARRRTNSAFANAAAVIGCEVAALKAVVQVETSGSGFDKQGRPKILFEPHKFYALLSGQKRDLAVQRGLAYPKWGEKKYPADSYPRLMAAMEIDSSAALKACSWGLPQILGSNFKAAGFPSVEAMVAAFIDSEDAQIRAMAQFIVNTGLAKHLRNRNFASFAAGYNGPSYKKNAYDTKMKAAYNKFAAEVAPRAFAEPDPETDESGETYDPVARAAHTDEPEPFHQDRIDDDEEPEQDEPPAPVSADVRGDPEIFSVQTRLKALNYYAGLVEGRWGGKTAGAITGFINDRSLSIVAPTDASDFAGVRAALKIELSKAEQEGWKRPVSAARKAADPKVVAEVAPESVPVRRNFLATAGASALAFFGAVYDTVKGSVMSAWQFWTDHGDSVPDDAKDHAVGFLSSVPPAVWIFLGAGFLIFLCYNAWSSLKTITEGVKSGER